MAETKSIEIICHTPSILNSTSRDVPVLAIPCKVIDIRLRELAGLIIEDGTERMKQLMTLLGYLQQVEEDL
jgi:hypothetical protein